MELLGYDRPPGADPVAPSVFDLGTLALHSMRMLGAPGHPLLISRCMHTPFHASSVDGDFKELSPL